MYSPYEKLHARSIETKTAQTKKNSMSLPVISLLEGSIPAETPCLETAAASRLVDDVYGLGTWLAQDLTLRPFAPQTDAGELTRILLISQDAIKDAEGSRVLGLPFFGE